MLHFDVETIRAQIRTMDFVRGTPGEVEQWQLDEAESRANLAIDAMPLAANELALFDMMLDAAVPPSLASQLVAALLAQGASGPTA